MLFSVVIVTPTREDDCVVLDTLLDVVSEYIRDFIFHARV